MSKKLNTTYISNSLAEKLTHISEYSVTTLVAPIGYGKTRALNWWADNCEKQLSDVTILRQMIVTNSFADCWRGFCRNLRAWQKLKTEMEELGTPTNLQSMGLMLELLYDAVEHTHKDIFYVIDDLHFLQDPAFTTLLLFLSTRLPENIHLVLSSRNMIFEQSDRLHLGAHLLELHVEDLRLSGAGIREYTRQSGILLHTNEITQLEKITEGWFSMVYLNLRTYLQTGHWSEHTSNIYPLMDEVLFRPLSERQRNFLVQLGVPDDFTAEEATFLWQDSDAMEILDSLTKQNAFITNTNGVYRYHNMLRSCAKEKFSLLSRAEQDTMLHRLGQWYERTGENGSAAECYEKTGDWDALLRIVGLDRGLSFGPERLPLVRRWMENCPIEILLRHPQAILVFMLLLFYARDIPEIHRYHALFERSMALCTDLSQSERDQLEGEALLRLSFLCFNDISAMNAYHRRIHALISADRTPWTQGSPSVLLLYHSKSGYLDRENAEMRECMPIYSRISSGHGSGAALMMQGETEFFRGNFANAAILCYQAKTQALENNEYSIYTAAAFLEARLAQYEQPTQNRFAPLDDAADTLRSQHQYRLLTTVELGRAWLSALQGQIARIPAWMMAENSSIVQIFPLIEPIFQIVVGRVLLEQGKWVQVAARTSQLIQSCIAARFTLCHIYAHLQNAVAFMRLGKKTDARKALSSAWTLAQPDDILLPFAESDPCLDILLDELTDMKTRERIRAISARFRTGRKNQEQQLLAQYGLTQREKEITVLAAQRNSSREIAETLNVSVKSVNNRLNNIYDKLGLGGEGRNKRQKLIELMAKTLQ